MITGPFVVLEGPDGGGKTTLARDFERMGFRYSHNGPPEMPAYSWWLRRLRQAGPGPAVVDRLHVGSYVYGTAFRGQDDMSAFEHWLFSGVLEAADGALVYVRPPDATLEKNLERGPDSPDAVTYEDPARRELVRRLYDELFMRGNSRPRGIVERFWVYDYRRSAPAELKRQLGAVLHPVRQRLLRDDIPALGNVRAPEIALVGDEPHERRRILAEYRKDYGREFRPLADLVLRRARRLSTNPTVFDSQSGRYLAMAMGVAGLTWRRCCLFNSAQLDGEELRAYVDATRTDVEFVALGGAASRRLTDAGIAHRAVPHPQYVKRFHYKRGLVEYPLALTGERPWE